MTNRILGAILLSAAALTIAIGSAGAQVARAIVLGQFYVARMSGPTPPGPDQGSPSTSVLLAAVLLAGLGAFLLFRQQPRE